MNLEKKRKISKETKKAAKAEDFFSKFIQLFFEKFKKKRFQMQFKSNKTCQIYCLFFTELAFERIIMKTFMRFKIFRKKQLLSLCLWANI